MPMIGGSERRTVEVQGTASGEESYGTGYLIAPGLVLTALHVAQPTPRQVAVRDLVHTEFTEAHVVWSDPRLDAALLEADRDLVGAGMTTMRFGELVCSDPGHRPHCTMSGFPKAMRRKAGADPERFVDDLKTVDGTIAPHTGSRSMLYGLEVSGALPRFYENWQGLSGAGVTCQGLLIGQVRTVDKQWDRSLMALPASQLLSADGFSNAVAEHTGMLPRLQAADLRPLLHGPPEPVLSSSYLLDPHTRTVALTGMSHLIDEIAAWCRTAHRVDVAALTGLGGTGKTRLLAEVLQRLATPLPEDADRRPWSGGFLTDRPPSTGYRLLGSSRYPLLVIVDLAESRDGQLADLLAALTPRHDGHTVRILLLARRRDSWWPSKQRELRALHAGPVTHTFAVSPDDAYDGRSSADIYESAKADFAHRIEQLRLAGQADESWRECTLSDAPNEYGARLANSGPHPVIYHHIAALADVLVHANPTFADRDHPLDVLLAHEENYVRKISEARLPQGAVDTKLIRSLITAQFLAGAATARDGQAVIRAGYDAHHSGYGPSAAPDRRVLAALDDILTAAYPSTDGAHWGAVGEPLAAALLTEVETDSGHEFVEQFLQHETLKPEQRAQTLHVVARVSTEDPALAEGAHRAVATAPDELLPLAVRAAAELDTDDAAHWLDGTRHAVSVRAAQPGADTAVYERAADLVRRAQDCVAAGTSPTTLLDNTNTSTVMGDAEPSGGGRSLDRLDYIMVKPVVKWQVRLLFTTVSMLYLLAITASTVGVAYSNGLGDGWAGWLYIPAHVGFSMIFAAYWGSGRLDWTAGATWIGPPLVVIMDVCMGALFHDAWPLPGHFPPAWLVWLAFCVPGIACLPFTWRIWFGRLQPRTPAHGEAPSLRNVPW
ncbi:hypothetical protein [Streptomyces sp. NPDC048361]|uniref:hypothetical protein n=1 Tax=Streptomyces sp. NPDC048361 TaxID=3154720 RepID=UPI0034273881